ncbi:hypothetical protein SUGI_1039410 [Cryptomeria japonica]|uniref:nuclear transcription factor Y subunit C-1 n=1 Tax=Cryptomeria japonica TaxID=3369 RepID=UPI002414BCD1|nr:nuclear transcription factor Y subunit C-1 [Cryptomeria japonica]GLJ49223.1 hypothetical protein SUGI_1039410 [Cryptomeria japonica]
MEQHQAGAGAGGGGGGGGGMYQPVGGPAYQQVLQQQQQQLHSFWAFQMQEIEQASDFKNHQLPLARIKKIMKADEDVRMISAEAPVLFAKACEMFILELTLRSWIHAEENKRRTLQKNDIAAAITRTDIFDFLVDIVPRDDPNAKDPDALPLARDAAYFYPHMTVPLPMPQPMPGQPPSVMLGRPAPAAMQMDPSLYMQPPRTYAMPPHHMWQQQQQQILDGQAYGQPHSMTDGQPYLQQQMPDGQSYGTPPPSSE